MISFRQITNGIGKRLEGCGYDVYDERNIAIDGRSALQVSVIGAEENQAGPRYFDRRIKAQIMHSHNGGLTNEEFYTFIGKMNLCLRQPICFADRCIMPKDFTGRMENGQGIYEFYICFLDDGIEGIANEDEMNELILEEGI